MLAFGPLRWSADERVAEETKKWSVGRWESFNSRCSISIVHGDGVPSLVRHWQEAACMRIITYTYNVYTYRLFMCARVWLEIWPPVPKRSGLEERFWHLNVYILWPIYILYIIDASCSGPSPIARRCLFYRVNRCETTRKYHTNYYKFLFVNSTDIVH